MSPTAWLRSRASRVTRVLVRETIADAGVELLRSRFDVDVDLESPLADVIAGYDAIVIRSQTKLDAEVLERATSLRVIGRGGVGVDNIDVGEATRRGILVVNAPESTVVSAAEHTIGLLLALSRNIAQAQPRSKAGRWERSRYGGHKLAGKMLGVLGFGRIGQQVARRALALGMHVLAFDPFVSRERFRELGVERAASQEDVFASSDIVSLHLPLTDETRAAVNEETLAHAKKGIASSTRDGDLPVLEHEILFVRLEERGRELRHLGLHLPAGQVQGRAAHRL